MSSFQSRKEERKAYYENFVKGWKLIPCVACNGSGHYDHNGSPKCGSCNGTGKIKAKLVSTSICFSCNGSKKSKLNKHDNCLYCSGKGVINTFKYNY